MEKLLLLRGHGETGLDLPIPHAVAVNKIEACQHPLAEPSQPRHAFIFTHSLTCISMHQVIGTCCLRSCLAARSFLHRSASLEGIHMAVWSSRVTAKRLAHGSTRNRTRASLLCVRFEGRRGSAGLQMANGEVWRGGGKSGVPSLPRIACLITCSPPWAVLAEGRGSFGWRVYRRPCDE